MTKLESKIKEQITKWKEDNFNHPIYYLSNMVKLAFGYEPSYISPNNILVNSYINTIDNRSKQ